MSFNLTINFDKFEDLESFVNYINKFKNWKSKQEIKKKTELESETKLEVKKKASVDKKIEKKIVEK